MVKLLIATNNPGKVKEYKELLAGLPLELTYPAQEGLDIEVAETGESFAENARLKATAYARASGLLTLADDSGLEVDALGGEPGIRSARYAGSGASDEDRYQLLLEKLRGVPWEERIARFRCVIAVATPGGQVHIAEGSCEGIIAFEPKGEHGFGYDPVFHFQEYGKTMAELPLETKNKISHRAKAAQRAREILRKYEVPGTSEEIVQLNAGED
jgi:XTP/dITP diphosphohydrolase